MLVSSVLQIGIDIEEKRRKPVNNILSLAHRYFSPYEVQYLASFMDPESRQSEFLRLWTLKVSKTSVILSSVTLNVWLFLFFTFIQHICFRTLLSSAILAASFLPYKTSYVDQHNGIIGFVIVPVRKSYLQREDPDKFDIFLIYNWNEHIATGSLLRFCSTVKGCFFLE